MGKRSGQTASLDRGKPKLAIRQRCRCWFGGNQHRTLLPFVCINSFCQVAQMLSFLPYVSVLEMGIQSLDDADFSMCKKDCSFCTFGVEKGAQKHGMPC